MTRATGYRAYRFDSFTLDIEGGTLLDASGKEIPLRPKSFTLLRLLVENSGKLLSQDVIMDALWPNVFVTENNVTQCIHNIRRALGPGAHRLLRTRPRRGYLFIAKVEKVPHPATTTAITHRNGDEGGGSRPQTMENDCWGEPRAGDGEQARARILIEPLPRFGELQLEPIFITCPPSGNEISKTCLS